MPVTDLLLLALAALAVGLLILLLQRQGRLGEALAGRLAQELETRQRAQSGELHQTLAQQAERVQAQLSALQVAQTERLADTREAVVAQFGAFQSAMLEKLAEQSRAEQALLQDTLRGVSQQFAERAQELSKTVDERLAALSGAVTGRLDQVVTQFGTFQTATLEKLAEQGRAERTVLQDTLRGVGLQFAERAQELSKTVDGRLAEISGKVAERLDEGFKKTNETFTSVMSRLAVIDEAQKKIEGLATNVVGLQEILGDKRSRGAFGEVQLEALVRNALPPDAYAFQATLKSGVRADCLLDLPEPTGKVAIDSKFPLENFRLMNGGGTGDGADRDAARRQFKADVKKHIDDIAAKYIVAGETSDGAVLFLPAEAVFAEIHAHHPELVEHAQKQRVWLTSPTTLMAVLNTARAVIRDTETRRMAHVIKDELGKLAKDFGRFDERMKKLATHIEQANKDVADVRISSDKISKRFAQIERVELESHGDHPHMLGMDDET